MTVSSYLEKKVEIDNAESGHVQFIRTSAYREAGMENENFKAYAPEDKERLHRFVKLGYNVEGLRTGCIIWNMQEATTPG